VTSTPERGVDDFAGALGINNATLAVRFQRRFLLLRRQRRGLIVALESSPGTERTL